MLRSFEDLTPRIAESAYVDDAAVVIGDVVVEAEASIWPNTTLRGDRGQIVVGERANVQDNAVLHEDALLGPESTVGHSAIVHAATVESGGLVGINAVVLDDAHVGADAVVGAGAVVTEGTEIPASTLAVGTPAEPKAELDSSGGRAAASHYAELSTRHAERSEAVE
jgi:carbonic anhydrase/acetyltransferase-like protein (isoleucine patch superfamily)